jgi:hypothetical protein
MVKRGLRVGGKQDELDFLKDVAKFAVASLDNAQGS